MTTDPVELTARLVQCASVTPEDAGAIPLLQSLLTEAGFSCFRADRGGISNLVARWGDRGDPRTFGFNGHTDVVPVGDPADWSVDPFSARIADGIMTGRGTTDMKSGVAAFVAAAIDFVKETPPDGAILLTVTGDEEGDADHGTRAILDWMTEAGEAMAVCLVGEPTCPETFGDMIKIGRRGSVNVAVRAVGVQGHAAYPHRARNPVSAMAALMDRLSRHVLDEGSAHFDPSTLAVTSIDTGNAATNVIPATCRALFNIRFNDLHTSKTLLDWIGEEVSAVTAETGVTFEVTSRTSGESFITPPGDLSDLVAKAVTEETGVTPALSTTGGTSDARFIRGHCPVVEFGLVGKTMHQVDECVEIDQIRALKSVYMRVLRGYFSP